MDIYIALVVLCARVNIYMRLCQYIYSEHNVYIVGICLVIVRCIRVKIKYVCANVLQTRLTRTRTYVHAPLWYPMKDTTTAFCSR